ncbi:acyl-CoA desaturase [Streptomyces sp. NPDC002730]|uniref:acyl-CoA desaturase n=1 Tax=Streptomyces sp. NPDC002730 TaxID=3364662 RepID=UPI00368B4DCA
MSLRTKAATRPDARPESRPDAAPQAPDAYDGTAPFPLGDDVPPRSPAQRGQLAVTALIVMFPFLALLLGGWLLWGRLIGPADVLLALAFYGFTGLGVTAGFHRLLTHRSFTASPALLLVLTTAGSMSFQGDVIGWVAIHRRHHAFTDRPGDPHSPFRYGTSLRGQLRGLAHAHVGWLFQADTTPAGRYAPDLLADRSMRALSRAFPVLCLLSLTLPFAAGWAIGGTVRDGLTALLWAGLVRIALLQHVTWSVNSLCHMIGERPFRTRRHDRATNLWPLALLSFGESWHNLHHADPTCARHGVDRGQLDPTAAAIRLFERLGWATDVHWPVPARLDDRRR